MPRTYQGKPIERGGTSIRGRGAAPAVRWLVEKGLIKPGMKVLDYGAGKYARNADYLRKLGCKVYAYDPFNYNTTGSGYAMGAVTKRKPSGKFDVAFTCFVLNVIPDKKAKTVIRETRNFGDVQFHIVRDQKGLMKVAGKALRFETNNEHIRAWYYKHYRAIFDPPEDCEEAGADEAVVRDFCRFGFQTDKDKWQRLVTEKSMRGHGFKQLCRNESHALYADRETAALSK